MQEFQNNNKKEFTEALGKVLNKLQKQSKRSVRSIAYETGMSKTTLLLSEKGLLDPQLTTFCKIAEAFYIKPDKLLQMVYNELPENWSFID